MDDHWLRWRLILQSRLPDLTRPAATPDQPEYEPERDDDQQSQHKNYHQDIRHFFHLAHGAMMPFAVRQFQSNPAACELPRCRRWPERGRGSPLHVHPPRSVAMERSADDACHRTSERGVPPPDQDAGRAALRRNRPEWVGVPRRPTLRQMGCLSVRRLVSSRTITFLIACSGSLWDVAGNDFD